MAKTYSAKCVGTDEEFTYTVYARYMRDDYQGGHKRYCNTVNQSRSARLQPSDTEPRWFEVTFYDSTSEADFYASVPVLFRSFKDSDRMAVAWVDWGK